MARLFRRHVARWVLPVLGLLLNRPCARAAPLVGAVDTLTTSGTSGWACNGTPDAGIAVHAGSQVVGIFPMTVDRPDAAPHCPGRQRNGFSIRFDAATQALFTSQTLLSVDATAPGIPSRLLPGGIGTVNPLPMPTGALLGLDAAQQINGTVSAAGGVPTVSLFAGGPANGGEGMDRGPALKTPDGAYRVRLPVPKPPGPLAAGELLPVFGSVRSRSNAVVGLAAPISLHFANGAWRTATLVPLVADVAQHGAVSGIGNTLFTTWLPPQTGFAGLSGTVSFSGNDPTFSEALVQIGATGDTQAICAERNGRTPVDNPSLSHLWAGILKSNDTGRVSIPINVALHSVVPGQPGGTCLMTWISAGYPFLSSSVPRYTHVNLSAQATVMPVDPGAPNILPFGMGGEFRFTSGPPAGYVYVGIMATKALAVDGIAATESAAPVLGAPAGSGWSLPVGNWTTDTAFMVLPAAVCAAAHLVTQPVTGPIAVLRNGTPAPMAIPVGAIPILSLPIASRGAQPIQRSMYVGFRRASHSGAFSGTLLPGDCLVAYMTGVPGAVGALDLENQSTVYFRVLLPP